MISIVSKFYPDDDWDELLLSSEFGTYFQSTRYAKFRKESFGHKPIFLRFRDDEENIVGQLLLFQYRLGLERFKKKIGYGRFFSFFKKFAIPVKHLIWNYGPIVFESKYRRELMISYGKFLLSEKYTFNGFSHPLDQLEFPLDFGFKVEKNGTFIIDLQTDLDSIFENTNKHSVRKNIKRAEDRGITIRQIKSEDDFLSHYNLLKEHRERNNLIYPSKEIVLENFRAGKNKGLSGFLAIHNDLPVASIIVVYVNGYIVEQGIARSIIDIKNKLYGQELLRWNIIKWGKENNYKYYDLAGVKLENRNSKEEGIFRNKEKWGGKLICYSIYSKK